MRLRLQGSSEKGGKTLGKNIRGFNLIFILLLGALLLMVWSSSMNQMQDNYTRGALEKDLEAGNVSSAIISQRFRHRYAQGRG